MKRIYQSLVIAGALVALSTSAFAEGNRSHGNYFKTKPYNSSTRSEALKDTYISHNGYNSNMRPSGSAVTRPYSPKDGNVSDRVAVKRVQNALRDRGYFIATDGAWGNETVGALRHFQKRNGLKQTGVVDEPTYVALRLNAVDANGNTYRTVRGSR